MSEKSKPNNLVDVAGSMSQPEFELFYQVPETNPLMILDGSGEILFANKSFGETFCLDKNSDFFNLRMEPDLKNLIDALGNSNFSDFRFELTVSPGKAPEENHYNVIIERVLLENRNYSVVIFKSFKEKSGYEDRINNLNIALEYGKVPVIIVDKEGIIKYATTSFEKILKFNIEEIFNKPLSGAMSLYLSDDETGQLDSAISGCSEWSKTIFSTAENGNTEYYEIKLRPVYKSPGDIHSFILTANDITHYVLKNLFVKKSEERLKSIINNISDLLLIFQKKENVYLFENANDNFCRIFSIDKNRAVNKTLNSLIEKPFFLQLQLAIQEFYIKDSTVVEFTYRSAKQKAYSAKITFIEPRSFEDTLYILSMQDITDQVHYREQLEVAYEKEINLNKLKTAFLENMSHEIRTPFNAILGYSDIIDDCIREGDYDTIFDLMSSFKDVMNRVLKLFNNIVEVFQISSGELEIELVTLNINQVLKAVHGNREREAKQKGLEFKLETEDKDLNIKTDWTKFERIINSLVDNSIKYTEQGNIMLKSRMNNNNVEITIADTGKGIMTDNISRLCEPFVQEEEAYLRNYEGAGLGLTIAYKLTQLMGGSFNINSAENSGTEIILSFPSAASLTNLDTGSELLR